jgi:hypothetical protein
MSSEKTVTSITTNTQPKPLKDFQKNVQNGVWLSIHWMAKNATTPELQIAYSVFFRSLCKAMNCSCESHCIKMLSEGEILDPSKYRDNSESCFKHSYLCHEAVNARLGKPSYKYEDVKAMYYNEIEGAVSCMAPEINEVSNTKTSVDDVIEKFPGLFIKSKYNKQIKNFRLVNDN